MLYILHGDDIVSSRKKLTELTKGVEPVYLEGKKVSIGEIEMAVVSDSMFGDKKTIVIEQFSKIKANDKLTEILKLVETDSSLTMILWDEADLTAKTRSFKKAQNFSFTFPKVYFQFMDSLAPTASPQAVKTLHEVLRAYEPEQVLYSIIKRLRQLLILKSSDYQAFSEFSKMQDWQLGKLRTQSGRWTESQLKHAFISYASLDEKIKTGGLTMDLPRQLDILLVSDLN